MLNKLHYMSSGHHDHDIRALSPCHQRTMTTSSEDYNRVIRALWRPSATTGRRMSVTMATLVRSVILRHTHVLMAHTPYSCLLTSNHFFCFFMVFFQKGWGGLGRSKSFESLLFCPEAIKSKQMPLCQKAKNSEKVTQKFQK